MQRVKPKITVVSVAVILIVVTAVIIHLKSGPVEHIKVYEVQREIEAPPESVVVRSASRVPAVSVDVAETTEAWSKQEEATPNDDTLFGSEFMDEERGVDEVPIAEEDALDEELVAAMHPPPAPSRGVANLIESFPDDGTYEEYETQFMDYAFTYYPLTLLESEEVNQLDPRVQAAYHQQKAAFHREFVEMFRADVASMSPETLSMITPDMATALEKEGVLP